MLRIDIIFEHCNQSSQMIRERECNSRLSATCLLKSADLTLLSVKTILTRHSTSEALIREHGLCKGEGGGYFLFGSDFSTILFQSFYKKGRKWTHCHHRTICLRATPLTEAENRDVEGSSISELEEWRVINCSRLLVGVLTTFLNMCYRKDFVVSP